MGTRSVTVDRFKEIERRLRDGRGLREIARALKCSRKTVREVRDGLRQSPAIRKATPDPLWMSQIDWPAVLYDLGLGHPLKFVWEERAQSLTGYPNFWKQFYRKFPELRQATVTARDFMPAERVEVDWAGDPVEWVDLRTGELRHAWVYVAGLGFSQLLFAWATDDMKSRNWLDSHQRMYAFYGGVPHVTVPDCLKQGVLKCHLYDPDLNPTYAALAAHYTTAVVPARPGHPRDKAIVEGLVKILMRYLRFRYRRQRFTSLTQINEALAACVTRINDRRHTRFGVSRRQRFECLNERRHRERDVRRRRRPRHAPGRQWLEPVRVLQVHADRAVRRWRGRHPRDSRLQYRRRRGLVRRGLYPRPTAIARRYQGRRGQHRDHAGRSHVDYARGRHEPVGQQPDHHSDLSADTVRSRRPDGRLNRPASGPSPLVCQRHTSAKNSPAVAT